MTINPVATNLAWGPNNVTTGVTDKAVNASCTNTEKLVALGAQYEVAIAANNYKAGNKKWCLPSYDLLYNINESINFNKVNNGIRIAQGTILGNVYTHASGAYSLEWIRSSSEESADHAWNFMANTQGKFYIDRGAFGKESSPMHTVRAVAEF